LLLNLSIFSHSNRKTSKTNPDMKKKIFLVSGIIGIALTLTVFTGCHKDSPNTPATNNNTTTYSSDITSAQDESNASDAMNDSKNISDASAQGNSNQYHPGQNVSAIYSAHCVVTWAKDTLNGYDTMYVNFGGTPVRCNDGRWRQGEIIVYWARKTGSLLHSYFDSASTITMTFNNYAAGNTDTSMIGVAGTRAWTNTGSNLLSQQNWDFTANLTLTYANKQTATWNSTRTNSLVKVGADYYYEISGSASGIDRNNVHYTLNITTPLYVTALPWWLGGCPWIESGMLNINLANNVNTLTVNFGTLGTCTPIKTATYNNHTYTFIMW
jgi:hypothetical protein